MEHEILQNYHNPLHPTAFGGINTVHRYYDGEISRKQIEKILKKSYSYSKHKETKKPTTNPYFVYSKHQQFQIDLIEVISLSKYNRGVKYLLTCIDVFTKKAFVRACMTKRSDEILNAFKSILDEAGEYPKTILSDKGAEIKNRKFAKFCKDNGIKQIFPENEVHAAVVERFNKTLQIIMYKYMTQNETLTYIDNLQHFVESYNSRYHRSIKMSPDEGEKRENHPKIFMEVDEKIRKIRSKRQTPKFAVGDFVRIKDARRKFKRSYETQFGEEVFKIYKIKKNLPIIMYKLKDLKDEKIIGSFYESELSATPEPESFKINKIIKRRIVDGEPQVFVSWKGYGSKFNQWIPMRDVRRLR